jgi:hypothetical protein
MNSSMRLGVKISTCFASIITACLSMPHGCSSPTGQAKINKREVHLLNFSSFIRSDSVFGDLRLGATVFGVVVSPLARPRFTLRGQELF